MTTTRVTTLAVDHQPGGGEHVAPRLGVKVSLISGGQGGGMGSQNLGPAGMVGCQPVGGGFSERARSQSGIDPPSVADQRQFGTAASGPK